MIYEGDVGIKKLHQRTIFGKKIMKKIPGLGAHGMQMNGVVLDLIVNGRQTEPLDAKTLRQVAGPRVSQHSGNLTAHFSFHEQSSTLSGLKQFVIGHILPQKVRQALGQLEGIDGLPALLLTLPGKKAPVEEFRRNQSRLEFELEGRDKSIALLALELIEDRLDSFLGNRSPENPRKKTANDVLRQVGVDPPIPIFAPPNHAGQRTLALLRKKPFQKGSGKVGVVLNQ